MSGLGALIGFILVLVVLGFGVWWGWSKLRLWRQPWIGIYYPNSDYPGQYEISSEFKDKDICLKWGRSKSVANPDDPLPAWDCGRGCKVNEFGLFLCEETVYYRWNRRP